MICIKSEKFFVHQRAYQIRLDILMKAFLQAVNAFMNFSDKMRN